MPKAEPPARKFGATTRGGKRHGAVKAEQFARGRIALTDGLADDDDDEEDDGDGADLLNAAGAAVLGLDPSPLANLGSDLLTRKIRPSLKANLPQGGGGQRKSGVGRRKSAAGSGSRKSGVGGKLGSGRKSRLSKVQVRRAGMAIDKSLDDLITGMNNRHKRRGTTRTPLALQWAISASKRGMTFTAVLDEWFNESDDLLQNGVLSMRELRRGLKILREDGTHTLTDDQIKDFANHGICGILVARRLAESIDFEL